MYRKKVIRNQRPSFFSVQNKKQSFRPHHCDVCISRRKNNVMCFLFLHLHLIDRNTFISHNYRTSIELLSDLIKDKHILMMKKIFTNTKQQAETVPTQCKICRAPQLYIRILMLFHVKHRKYFSDEMLNENRSIENMNFFLIVFYFLGNIQM